MDLALLAAMALAGSLHCAGMCGPLAAVAGRRAPVYLVGKTSTYILLGTLAGAAGHAISFAAGARVLSVIAAGLLILGLLRQTFPPFLSSAGRHLALLAREGAAGALLLGAANGLLPCPLTYAFVALAAASGSVFAGAATMLILGIVTALPLCAFAWLGTRLRAPALSGALMLAAAALILWRGFATACH